MITIIRNDRKGNAKKTVIIPNRSTTSIIATRKGDESVCVIKHFDGEEQFYGAYIGIHHFTDNFSEEHDYHILTKSNGCVERIICIEGVNDYV